MHDAWLYPILSSNILTKFAHGANIINKINLILNAKILVNTDLYFYGLQKVMVSCPFPLRTGSKFVGNLFRSVRVKGHKPATCSIADINSIRISW